MGYLDGHPIKGRETQRARCNSLPLVERAGVGGLNQNSACSIFVPSWVGGSFMQLTTKISRRLRRDMTRAERRLWNELRAPRFKPFHVRRQCPVGPYFADFLSHRGRLVIEVDGGQHGGKRDALRDDWFLSQGYVTHRVWNNDVFEDTEAAAEVIHQLLVDRTPP